MKKINVNLLHINNLKDAKEQFEIMFINEVLQDNNYSLRKLCN